MYKFFSWTEDSHQRNRILNSYELLQPFVFLKLSQFLNIDNFFDIGANIGAYSLFFSKLKSIKKIFSFEADVETFSVLQKNIVLNNLQELIVPKNYVVSEHAGSIEFGYANHLSGINAVVETSFHRPTNYTKKKMLQSISLDNFKIKEHRLAVKIDVEGHELCVVKGMTEILKNNLLIIQCEAYVNAEDLWNIMNNLGYVQILKVGPDIYFTNYQHFSNDLIVHLLEECFADIIEYNINKEPKLSCFSD